MAFTAPSTSAVERPSPPVRAAGETLKSEKPICGPGPVRRLVTCRPRSVALVANPDSVTPGAHPENQLDAVPPAPERVNALHRLGRHQCDRNQRALLGAIRTVRVQA